MRDPQAVGSGRAVGSLLRRVADRSGTSLGERSVLLVAKVERWSPLSPLTSEMAGLGVCPVGFGLAFAQYFITMPYSSLLEW